MKIIRFNKDDLRKDKDIIRKTYGLDSKDTDNEIYRILIPVVPNTTYLPNVIETFVESKKHIKTDFGNKYSFHCANHNIVDTINKSIINGTISDYHEFEMPTVMSEG